MITRRDCILLLSELSAKGIDTSKILPLAINNSGVNLEVIKFINSYRQFEANAFYEKLRKSYNNKKSNLYKNIVTCDEIDCTDNVLTTLSALVLQISLYLKQVDNTSLFLRQIRYEEILQSLLNYTKTFNLVPCIQVLQIIKADLKAFEYINNNKDNI